MEKRLKRYYLIAFVALALIIVLILVSIPKYFIQFGPEDIFVPPTPADCSDGEVKAVWDSIFKESSDIITIFSNTTDPDKCTLYFAKKIINNTAWVLFSSYEHNNYSIGASNYSENTTIIKAIWGNYTTSGINLIIDIDEEDLAKDMIIRFFEPLVKFPNLFIFSRNITNISEGKNEFDKTFKIENMSDYFSMGNIYFFEDYNFSENHTKYIFADGMYQYQFDEFAFIEIFTDGSIACIPYWDCTFYGPCTDGTRTRTCTDLLNCGTNENKPTESESCTQCVSNWTVFNTTCRSDETYVYWYQDTNACPVPTDLPTNLTFDCDYDNNGVIGTVSSINKNNLNTLTIDINNRNLNLSSNYNSTREVEIYENSLIRVRFNHNFSTPLNFRDIELQKQRSSDDFGYLIVNGIENEKNVYVDRIINKTQVCVREKITSDIDDVSEDCEDDDEILIDCPGDENGLDCTILTNRNAFRIDGLSNSAVKEFTGNVILPPSCTVNWTCAGWGTCTNSRQTRICTDQNSCNVTTGKPPINQSCTSPCVPNWDCTTFTPSECPDNGMRNRTCSDINNCGTTAGKPPEVETCGEEPSSKRAAIIIFIIVIAVIVIGLAALLIHILLKKGESEKSRSNISLNMIKNRNYQ